MLSWRTARRTSGLSVAAVLVLGLLVPSTANAAGTEVTGGTPGTSGESSGAVKVAKHEIPTRSVPEAATPHVKPEPGEPEHAAADHVVGDLRDTNLRPFSMFGVTWQGGLPAADTVVEARWRSDGTWSKWTELHVDPAPGESGRPGTEPQWVGSADAADVRVLSKRDSRPVDLSLTTIDADSSKAATASTSPSAATEVTPAATVTKPAIILRSSWGAAPSSGCDSPRYGTTTRGAVIHHTAGSNTYTKAQSAGIVRATQAYHMKGRDWCDIGYNFLVDKYGQIFEGRAGGIDEPVRAAHSGNDAVNRETMGVSLMGTFSSTEPSAAMKTSVVNLVAWRFSRYNIPATGTYSLGGKTLNRIAGHRNVVSTECPGAKAYAWLSASGGLRTRVAGVLANGSALAPLPTPTGLVVTGRTTTSVSVDWTWVPGAEKYHVKASTSSTMSSPIYGKFTESKGTVTGLKSGTTYYFAVAVATADSRSLRSGYTPAPRPSTMTLSTSASDTVTVPSSRTMTVAGHGYGHGIGMSQYGAQGAAILGKDFRKILGYYYPGTVYSTSTVTMRVLISAATSSTLTVKSGSGLRFRRMPSDVRTLPATIGGSTVTQWRIKPVDSAPTRSALQYRTDAWRTYTPVAQWTGDAQFERSTVPMTLVLPDGSTRQYRSRLRAALPSTGATTRKTVNLVTIDDYTRGVVAAEMPSSWRAEALKTQAVAARTYGRRAYRTTSYYDICDTTSCQVYRGASGETAATNAAVAGTKGIILMYAGVPAFTQFSSSSGGASAAGSQPYLKAKPDQFDDFSDNPNHSWSDSFTAGSVEKKYPTIGTLKKITVTKRNGVGDWGGRVLTVSLVGSAKTITISGESARSAFGLKSSWFRF